MGATATRASGPRWPPSPRRAPTSDNPRTEDPDAILDDVRAGLRQPEAATRIADRQLAIRYAAEQAQAGDVIVIAGKGHETYQIIGTTKRDFDDRIELANAFTHRTEVTAS